MTETERVNEVHAWEIDDFTLYASVPEECLAVALLHLGHWPYEKPFFALEPERAARILRVLSATMHRRDKYVEKIWKSLQEIKSIR